MPPRGRAGFAGAAVYHPGVSSDDQRTAAPAGVRVRCVRKSSAVRFAEREVRGVDDRGEPERIVIWIERLPGALWAVGRAVNPQYRPSEEARPDDYVFQGYELSDALEAGNETLEDDARVSEQDGRTEKVKPFVREELLRPLERWFFGR
jgi:hypothetical protein